MVEQAEPPHGLTLAQAMEESVDVWRTAHYAAFIVPSEHRDMTLGEMYDAFAGLLHPRGGLLARGRPDSPEASYEDIPAAAFSTLRPLDRDSDTLKDGSHTWYEVRFYKCWIVKEWRYLKELNEQLQAGLTLVEALESLASAGELDNLRAVRDKNFKASPGTSSFNEPRLWQANRDRFDRNEALDRRHRELFRDRLKYGEWVLWGDEVSNALASQRCYVPAHIIDMLGFDFGGNKVEAADFSIDRVRVHPRGVNPAGVVEANAVRLAAPKSSTPKNSKSSKPKELGRPTRKREIKAAFGRLRDNCKLRDCKKLVEVYPLVRTEVCNAAKCNDETGLGDEAIRKRISRPFKAYLESRKPDNKL